MFPLLIYVLRLREFLVYLVYFGELFGELNDFPHSGDLETLNSDVSVVWSNIYAVP